MALPGDTETYLDELTSIMRQMFKIMHSQSGMSIGDRMSTLLQKMVLKYIEEKGNASMSDLAEQFHMSLPSVNQLVARLEKTMFLVKRNDEKDKRITRVFLTPEGKRELQRLMEMKREKFKKIFSVVPKEDLQTLIRIHKDILNKLQ